MPTIDWRARAGTLCFDRFVLIDGKRIAALHAFDKYTELKTTWLRTDA
jgi:hypothetical protein